MAAIFLMLITVNSAVFAQENISLENNKGTYNNEEIVAVYRMTEQGLKEVDKEEYLAKLNEMNKKKEEIEQQKNGIIINNSEQFSIKLS